MNYRIQSITVEGLFGMFDHHIPLNQKERITIVYGVNGIGKTMIMRMVDHLFKGEFGQLRLLPFKLLSVQLNEGFFINVEKAERKLIIHYKSLDDENKSELGTFTLSNKKRERILKHIAKNYSTWRVIGRNIYDRENDKTYDIDDIVYKFPQMLPPYMSIGIEDDNLKKMLDSIHVYFIPTQRLKASYLGSSLTIMHGAKVLHDDKIDAVDYYSRKISKLIQEKEKEYGQKARELESSLGKRLLEKQIKTNYTIEALHEEIQHLDKKRAELKRVGLLRENGKLNFNKKADEISRGIMSANVEDMKIKLKVFDDGGVYKKLNLFLEILNKRLSFKKLSISAEEGFILANDNDEIIQAKDLSSGEQHELIMLYQLFFEAPENALVMIDEPEISHHIMWKKSFVEDMLEIIKLRNFDVYVNTHSPSIVNGNWDMTIPLRKEELVEEN